MKKLVLLVAIGLVTLASCTTENTAETKDDQQLFSVEQSNSRSMIDCVQSAPCDQMTYEEVVPGLGGTILHITWDSSLTQAEIDCARSQYWRCFRHLKMVNIQPTDPLKETWWSPLKPEVGVTTTSNDDPRMCVGC